MTRTDLKLLVGLLLLALLILFLGKYIFAHQQSGGQASVKVEGQVVLQIDLNQDTGAEPLRVQGKIGTLLLEVRDKKVRIYEATCPDQICVHQGWIASPGQAVICVPNELVLYINDKASLDAIIR